MPDESISEKEAKIWDESIEEVFKYLEVFRRSITPRRDVSDIHMTI